MSKILYSFFKNKEIESVEKRTETVKNDDGSTSTRTYEENVKKKIPVEIQIRMPNRRELQEADMEYSIEFSSCIKQGILTKAMMLNKFQDTGGLISEKDSKQMLEATKEILDKQNELERRSAVEESLRDEEDNRKIEDLKNEIVRSKKDLIEKEVSYINLFNNTADSKAQNKIILWYILNLTQYKDPSQKHISFVPMFQGKNFKEKEAALFDIEDGSDAFIIEVYPILASIISYWYFTGKVDESEFEKIVNGK